MSEEMRWSEKWFRKAVQTEIQKQRSNVWLEWNERYSTLVVSFWIGLERCTRYEPDCGFGSVESAANFLLSTIEDLDASITEARRKIHKQPLA